MPILQLTSRQQALLRYLAGMTSFISVREIARRFGYGERTIRYDLEMVEAWLKTQGGELLKRPNAGVMMKGSEALRERIASSFEENAAARVFTPEDRCEAIYCHLLFSRSAVRAEELANFLGVSAPTVMRDIRGMGQWMEAKQLSIASKKGEGYRLWGNEAALRSCLVDALLELLSDRRSLTRYSLTNRLIQQPLEQEDSLQGLARRYLSAVDLDALADLLDYSREVVYHTMPESDYIRLLLYLAVLMRRASEGALAPEESGAPEGEDQRERRLAGLLAERLNVRFHLELGDGETALLARWLISCNIKFPPKSDDKLAESLSYIVDEMLEVLHSYPNFDMPDFFRDKLKVNLLAHLRLTIKKYHLQISSPNPLLAQMKVNYPEIFVVVYQMAEVFQRRTNIPLDEDEIGFIAIHIAANIEECNRLRSKKALIVCNTGQGAARVLQNRIRNNIPRLEIQGTLSALDAENMDALRDVDFVISTVEMPQLEKPVFQVSPIISAAEIDRINRYLNGKLSAPESQQLSKNQEYLQDVFAQLAEKYVSREDRERFRRELESIVPFGDWGAAQPLSDMSEENITFQSAMILARVGGAISQLGEEFGIAIPTDKLFGMVIHVLMSIPRWRKGISNREYASEQYKNDNIYVYEFLARQLREISEEYGIQIPAKEALALMRYFL